MKRKFSLLALCLAALMCCSLFLFAACETDDPTGTTNTITATLSETEVTVGETVTLTYSATEGTVTVTVSKDGGAAETVTGTTFTPDAAGTYVFTFAAEGATSVTRTLTVTEAQQPAAPVITAAADQTEITAGESVTLTWSATESAAVIVTYIKDGAAADTLKPVSGQPLTIAEAGTYVFTFAAEGAESKTVTVKVNEAVTPVITLEVFDEPVENNGSDTACVGTEITYAVSVTENAVATASVTINNGAAQPIAELTGSYTFSAAGTYVFTIEADGAADFVYTVKADAHTYGAWRLDTTPSATQKGELVRTCPNCFTQTPGHTDTEELPEVTAENIGSDKAYTQTSLTPATCAEKGSATYSVNGYENISFTLTLPVDSTAHKYTAVSVPYNGDTMGVSWGQTVSVSWGQTVSVTCDNGCDTPLVLTTETLNKMDLQPDTENDYTPPTHTQAGSGNYFGTAEQDGYTVTVTVVGVPIPAEGTHTYGNVTTMTAEDYAAALAKDGGNYTLTCTYSGCSVTFTFELFATSDEGWEASDVQNASCTAAGSKTLSRTVSGEDSSGQSVEITLIVTGVEIPKIDHDLQPVAAQAATCTESGWNAYWQCSVCDEIFTADDQESGTGKTEVTENLTGIYLAPLDHDFEGQPYVYDEENGAAGHYQVCSHGCGTKSEVIPHNYGDYSSNASGHSRVCSVCFYEETGSHSGSYAFVAGRGVVFTCSVCGDDFDCTLTGIDVTAGSDAYIVDNGDDTFTAYGFTVEAVYNGIAGVATTEVFIPLTEEGLTVSVDGTYKATVTFAYDDVQDTPDGTYTVYTDTISGGTVNEIGQTAWTPYSQPLATLQGEFEYRFTLSNLQRNATKAYNSWLITLAPANGSTDAKVRPDNWVADNFGLVSGQGDGDGTDDAPNFTYTTNAEAGKYLNGFDYSGDLAFVLTRTYADGVYTTTIRVVQGSYWATFELVEPATAGNAMKVYLAADCVTYTYSDVLYAEKGLTMSSITGPAEATQVIAGTSLETALAGISLTVAYEESALTDTLAASACSITDNGGYAADTADTYTVTLSYGEFSVEVDIQVVGANTQDLVFYKNEEVVTGDQVVAGNEAARNTGGLTAYTDQALDGRIALSADTDYSSTWAGERGEFVAVKLDTSRDFTLEYTADVYTDVLSVWRAPAFMVSNGEEIASTLNGHAADLVIRGDAWKGLSSNGGAEVTLTQTVAINTNLWRYSVNTSGDPAYISEAGQDTLAAAYYTGAVTGVTTNWTVSYNAANHVFTVTVEVGDATIWSFTASSTLVTGTDMVMYIGGEGTYMNNISGTITYAAE